MIAALRRAAATTGRLIEAATNARTLARTVRILARQLDNAHLLAASEEARADRAEAEAEALKIERDLARDEVDAHRRAEADWGTLSGELAAEILAEPNLPDLTDAGEVPIPLVLTDSAREADIQRDRADALQRALRAAELDLIKLRAELESVAERKLAADIRADVQRERAEQAERDRDTNARAAGAHIATIDDLRKRLDDALRAVHKPAPAEQIPGVAAADDIPDGYWAARAERRERRAAIDAARDAVTEIEPPPPTRPSSATRTT